MMPSWRLPHIMGSNLSIRSSLLLLLSHLGGQAATMIITSPSNDTVPSGNLLYQLSSTQHSYQTQIELAPLTSTYAELNYSQFVNVNLTGTLIDTTAYNIASINTQDIALISCDPSSYSGYLGVTDVLTSVTSLTDGGPAAVLLYSSQSDHCNYTVTELTILYSPIFTILNATASRLVLNQLAAYNKTSNTISGDMSTSSSAPGFGSGNASSDPGTTSSSLAVSSPTTAVAMIILYTITGIITALFLGIIITGAVRAHRHPERYGPRNVIGRPRQSRARGIARAMLETIPIVKFGDSDSNVVTAAKGDVEMASRNEEDQTEATPTPTHVEGDAEHRSADTPSGENATGEQQVDGETVSAVESASAGTRDLAPTDGNNMCPICTDDFVKGQDVRVLPCNHQFHPECIDPWLINVSGTCPLCRIELNPSSEEAAPTEEAPEGQREDATSEQIVEDFNNNNTGSRPLPGTVAHRGLAAYLADVRHTRNAPVEERLAALRRLRQNREQQQGGVNTPADGAEETQGRRRHLAARLRERFRIRTRPHDGSTPSSPPSPPPAPHASR